MSTRQLTIVFLDRQDPAVGSSRIYGIHYPRLFRDMSAHKIYVRDTIKELDGIDVIIFGKRKYDAELARRLQEKGILCGSIQNGIVPFVDFFVGACQEEIDDLAAGGKPILFLPLVEDIYTRRKDHVDSERIVLAVHGAFTHLPLFYPHVNAALESVGRKRPIKLLAIYDIARYGKWKMGRPNIEVEDIQWDVSTVEENLLRADIGIVPNAFSIEGKLGRLFLRILNMCSIYRDPVATRLVRTKVLSNPGRALVFHQLGIPVIAGMSQASCSTIPSEEYGFLANSAQGWERAILTLAGGGAMLRRQIAENASRRAEELYSPVKWGRVFLEKVAALHALKYGEAR